MANFSYQAISESGKTVSGVIEADSLEKAMNVLSQQGYIPSKVTEKGVRSTGFAWLNIKERLSPVRVPDLILFTKQFRSMVRVGVPILNILQILETQNENPRLKEIIASMSMDIKEGATLYDAFRKHPKPFTPLYCSMLKAGEFSGALVGVLDRLIYIIEHEHKVKMDIKAALQYPVMVLSFLVIAFFVLLTFVIPRFVKVFVNAGLELPLPTRICMFLYEFLANYWAAVLGAAIAGIGVLVYYLRTEHGKYVRDAYLLKFPTLGPLLIKAAMSRFASIFAILYESGIHVVDSIEILTGTVGNTAISREFDGVKEHVKAGRGISGPLRAAKYFTPMVINMVAIGEESGNLDEMLREVSLHYDDEVDYAIKKLSDAIGPILIVGLAAVVGFFALSVFLPMWDLTGAVS